MSDAPQRPLEPGDAHAPGLTPGPRPRRSWRWSAGWWWLLVVPFAIGLARVRLDTEVLNLLPRDLPVVRGLQLYQRHFTDARELVVTVRAADAASAETAARQVAEALRRETNRVARVLWQPPWLEHPGEWAEFIAYLWLNQPPERFAELAQRLAPTNLVTLANDAREQLATSLSPGDLARLSYDPFGLSQLPGDGAGSGWGMSPEAGFASGDGTFRAVFVEAQEELGNYRACAAWLEAIRERVDGAAQAPAWPAGVTVRYTGAPVFVAEIATRMARDMQASVLLTLGAIAGLFGWAHRSWRPLGLLVLMLGLVMAGALAAGGLLFGTLNAISLGFGAILAGLAVDYGLVIYEEARQGAARSVAEIRRALWPSLTWASVTTALAFLLLNFAGLPGLSQLGSLVGIGVLLAPVVMLFLFLPAVLRYTKPAAPMAEAAKGLRLDPRKWRRLTVVAAVAAGAVVVLIPPMIDHSNRTLEPRDSQAQAALNELTAALNRQDDPLLVVVSGRDEQEVAERLARVEVEMTNALARWPEGRWQSPAALWPNPTWQRQNRARAAALPAQTSMLRTAAVEAGFTPEAAGLGEAILEAWRRPASDAAGLWPTNASARYLLQRAAAWTGTEWLAVGTVHAATDAQSLVAWAGEMHRSQPGVWITGWKLLGESLVAHVQRRVVELAAGIVLAIGLCLRVAFRRWREVLISFGALAFMLLVLQAGMSLVGGSWNLMSLAAVPVLLGAGVDYTLHVQWALRRHHGDMAAVRRGLGRALLLCAGTSVAGFGSNGLSSNAGLASLGLVCAFGVLVAWATAVYLVPAWWCSGPSPSPEPGRQHPKEEPGTGLKSPG